MKKACASGEFGIHNSLFRGTHPQEGRFPEIFARTHRQNYIAPPAINTFRAPGSSSPSDQCAIATSRLPRTELDRPPERSLPSISPTRPRCVPVPALIRHLPPPAQASISVSPLPGVRSVPFLFSPSPQSARMQRRPSCTSRPCRAIPSLPPDGPGPVPGSSTSPPT